MAITAAQLMVKVGADTSDAERGLRSISDRLGSVGKQAAITGGLLSAGLTAPLTMLGKSALDTASRFEDSMTRIIALTGTSAEQAESLGQKVLNLSTQLPQSATELADALYFVVSAGFKGDEAMQVLTTSARAAAAGLGETKVVADAVTSTLNAYKMSSDQATHVTDIMTAAVTAGKMEAADLAGALGRVLPIAAAAGVSFEQVAASIATMTRTGLDSDEATTALRGVLSALVSPGKEAAETLHAIGLSAAGLRAEIAEKGLLAALQDLMVRTGGNLDMLSDIIPNIRALTGVLSTAGSQSASYAQILDSMGRAAGRTDAAFEAASKTLTFQLGSLHSTIDKVLIDLASRFLPVITSVVMKIGELVTKIGELDPNIRNAALAFGAVLAAAGPVLVIVGALSGALALLLSPIGLVVVAVAGLAAAFAGDFGGIRTTLMPLLDRLSAMLQEVLGRIRALGRALADFWDYLSSGSHRDLMSEWFGPNIGHAIDEVVRAFKRMGQNIGNVWRDITSLFSGKLDVRGFFANLRIDFGRIFGDVRDIANGIARALRSAWQSIDFQSLFRTGGDLASRIIASIGDLGGQLISLMRDAWGGLRSAWPSIWRQAGDAWAGFTSAVGNLGGKVISWMQTSWAALTTAWPSIWQKAGDAWSGFIAAVGNLGGKLIAWLQNAWSGLVTAWPRIWQQAGDVWNGFITVVGDLGGRVVAWVRSGWAALVAAWPSIWQQAGDAWQGFVTAVGDVGGKVLAWLRNAWATLSAKWPEIWKAAGDITSGLWSQIKDYAERFTRWISEVAKNIDWKGFYSNFNSAKAEFQRQLVAQIEGIDWESTGRNAGYMFGNALAKAVLGVLSLLINVTNIASLLSGGDSNQVQLELNRYATQFAAGFAQGFSKALGENLASLQQLVVECFTGLGEKLYNKLVDELKNWDWGGLILRYLGPMGMVVEQILTRLRGAASQASRETGTGWSDVGTSSNLPRARASGGPVGAGLPYLVGELGPELFVPAVPGYVVPNRGLDYDRLARAIASAVGGNPTLGPVYVRSEMDAHVLAYQLGRELARRRRERGG